MTLSGAFGAIELFDSTTVAPSVSSASFTNLYTIGSKGLNLMCTAPATAKLSYTADGNGNVLVDNYITLQINGTPVQLTANNVANSPAGNVCQGSDASPDNFGGTFQQECFSAAYRANVTSLVGENTDSITSGGIGDAAGGIPPLDVSQFLVPPEGTEGAFPVQPPCRCWMRGDT